MTLAEFIQDMHNQVDKFQREWLTKNKEDGDNAYPLEMPEGEWNEQFTAWMELEEL